MNAPALSLPLVAGLAALAAGLALARWAPAVGWSDGPGPPGGRKRQAAAVPAVGGAAILVGLAVGWLLFDAGGRLPAALTPGRGLGRLVAPWLGSGATLFPLGACAVAFLVGLVDDLLPGGLRPRGKLLGQGLAGAVLGAPLLVSASVPTSAAVTVLLACIAGAVAAANLVNTFDNADGAAGSLGLLGLAPANALLAAPVAAFLALNLSRRAARRGPRTPRCYLGDAGSHLLGMLILMTPAAWPVLLVPALDLARLCRLRLRSGRAPWDADRRHLAHRLEARGVPRLGVPLLLAALAAPGLAGAWVGGAWALAGVAATAASFAGAVGWTPDPPEPAVAAAGPVPVASPLVQRPRGL